MLFTRSGSQKRYQHNFDAALISICGILYFVAGINRFGVECTKYLLTSSQVKRGWHHMSQEQNQQLENNHQVQRLENGERVIPLLPLRGLLVFPYMGIHLDVGREKSVSAID